MQSFFKVKMVLLSLFLFSQTLTSAQSNNPQLLSAFEDANQAVITGDSSLFFSIFPSNFLLVHGGIGKEFNLNQSWQVAKGMGKTPGRKAICDIIAIDVKESVAWITYHYSYKIDDSYQKTVNMVEDYKEFEWIGTLVFVKNNGKWQNVVWHTSNVPKK